VRPFAADDDGPTTATLDLPFLYAPYVMRDGDVLHLIGMEGNYQQVIRNAAVLTRDGQTVEPQKPSREATAGSKVAVHCGPPSGAPPPRVLAA